MRPFSSKATTSKSPVQLLAVIAVALCGSTLAACSSASSSFLSDGAASKKSFPVTPSTYGYTFQTVDDRNSSVNAVTGINQRGKIVGSFGGGSGSNISESYTSVPEYSKFRQENDPGAQGTVATTLSSNKIVAGYVMDPNNLGGTWGFVRIRGLWTLLEDPNEGTASNAVTKIFGINDSQFAVGSYLNSYGIQVAFEAEVPTETYTDLTPPGAMNAAATGIDGKGDIAGWETTSAGASGWFLQAGTYYPISYRDGIATYVLSLNWDDQVVGYYLDSNNIPHGFILTGPTKGGQEQTWETIDDPDAAYGTVVTGINNHHEICGYYYDASDIQHGFVAVPSPS
jgi:hypothetical protein